jgi:hypothetical protein
VGHVCRIIGGMYVEVSGSGVGLGDVDNFGAFAVVVEGEQDLGVRLAGLGVVEGEHVYFDAEAVKGLAGERASGEWGVGFDRMVEFARSKGWVDGAGRVRAHIERR